MKISLFLLSPFIYVYVWLYRIRERLFRLDIRYKYIPESIERFYLPVHMDLFWIRRGFLGRNKCLVPKGSPYSQRFELGSPWYQTWIGSYYLRSFMRIQWETELELVKVLGRAAIEDQNYLLKIYGTTHPESKIIYDSLKKVSQRVVNNYQQIIYYGEMITGVDDSISSSNRSIHRTIHQVSMRVSSIYNRRNFNSLLLEKDRTPSAMGIIRLFGYFSIIQINPRKFILTYVCGAVDNKAKINHELLRTINNIEVV